MHGTVNIKKMILIFINDVTIVLFVLKAVDRFKFAEKN